jgi:hypothetical protein
MYRIEKPVQYFSNLAEPKNVVLVLINEETITKLILEFRVYKNTIRKITIYKDLNDKSKIKFEMDLNRRDIEFRSIEAYRNFKDYINMVEQIASNFDTYERFMLSDQENV